MLAEADASCFEDFSSNELQEVCTLTRIIRIPRDGYILEHGKIASHLVFLIQGVVEIHTFGGAETDQGSEPGRRQTNMHSVAQVTSLGSFIGGASRRCTHSPRFVVRPIRSPNALGRSVVAPCFHQLEVSWVWGFWHHFAFLLQRQSHVHPQRCAATALCGSRVLAGGAPHRKCQRVGTRC